VDFDVRTVVPPASGAVLPAFLVVLTTSRAILWVFSMVLQVCIVIRPVFIVVLTTCGAILLA
jgi:hypothetical protein